MYIPSAKCTFAVRYIHTLRPKRIGNIFRYTSAKASDINYPFKDEKSANIDMYVHVFHMKPLRVPYL